MDRHCRWEMFELVGAEAAPPAPPHREDLWVVGMRPRRRQATPAQRRAILEAGAPPAGQPVFGERLKRSRTAAYLEAGHGDRSLGTLLVAPRLLSFSAALRPPNKTDYRLHIDLPGLADLTLPVKDHFLLTRAETAGGDLPTRVQALERAMGQMGETVAVRLGLSRPFAAEDATTAHCWLMADGFFSLADPQP
jgi:hypothetical protein